MRFLQQAVEEQRRKMRISQLLLLLLRCLALILLGLALAQPLLAGWLTPGSNRVIHLIIDDTLTTNATDPGQSQTRFETLKQQALSLIDDLEPTDTLYLRTLSAIHNNGTITPDTTYNPTEDRLQLIDLINNLKPTQLSRSSQNSLANQRDATHTIASTNPNQQHLALLLSDLSHANTNWQPAEANPQQPTPQNLQWLLSEPMPAQPNDQVRQLTPLRPVAIPDATGRNLQLHLTAQLARFTDTPVERTAQLRWQVFDAQGQPLLTLDDSIRLRPTDTTRTLTRVLTLPVDQALPPDQNTTQLFVQLTWLPDAQPDPLALDNHAVTTLVARRNATILIQHDARPGLTSARWLALAFNPTQADPAPITPQLATRLLPADLESADALFITSPNALNTEDALQLRAFAETNKPILVLPPQDPTTPTSLFETLNLADASFGPTLETDTPGQPFTEALPAAGPLSLLAAEWPTLARTVRTTRYHTPTLPSAQTLINLRTNDTTIPWLQATNLNNTQLLLFASRIEPASTNLPIKPLAVPLFQTLLRDTLNPQTIIPISPLGQMSPRNQTNPETLTLLNLNDEPNTEDRTPYTHAGLWRFNDDNQRFFITQIQPEAANLAAANRQLIQAHLNPNPDNVTWVAPGNWAAALNNPTPAAPAGRPILWLALLALLAELATARWSASGDRRWW